VNRREWYELLAVGVLALSLASAILAAAGAAFQQTLGVAASSLCAVAFLVPGLYFLGYSRRLRSRDLALAHAAAFARSRGAIRIQDLADELQVPRDDANRILRMAVEEGYLDGTFESEDRFVPGRPPAPRSPEGP
jgi:hypothetical protein